MISSPIPYDPGYGSVVGRRNSWAGQEERPKPRVKPEAEEIANKAKGTIANLLVTGQQVYRPPVKQKKEPKDFSQDNVRKMRQIQALNRRRRKEEEEEKNKPMKVLPQSEKYKEVSSKVSENLKQSPPPPRPASANFLRAHSRTGGFKPRGRSPSPASRPSSAAVEVDIEPPKPTNFIAHNAKLTKKYKPPRPPSALAIEGHEQKKQQQLQNYKKGEVPKYLKSRQKQWQQEEEERIRNTPDPDMPPGHRMMPTEERLKTLEILAEREKLLRDELHRLPLAPETLRAKSRKAEVEKQLAEVEEATKIFSRQKVFVKIDG
ncbi:Enkurin domain-containing protein 1 [Holothuria leucospilota]|uniref:Enkurin domain-containing protein 1 n=1 Tax=Holothuria leucospilota TaxID=206669 RepID=A0A9Q1BF24_HOLLE|nr:Enkurin domain-containing protein 1 [Holothuria leucospilota]